MDAIILSPPGAETGPCLEEGCAHRYCALVREQAGAKCGLCGEPVGYGRRHYGDAELGSVHATCFEARLEEEREERRRSWGT